MRQNESEPEEPRDSEAEYRKALRKGCDFLARRPHSARQLRQKLGRTFEPEVVERVLERLIELRYLDDSRFAVEFAAQRLEHAPRGVALLVAELRGRGVSAEEAEQAVAAALAERGEDEPAVALRVAVRKLASLRGESVEERRNRLLRFLTGRGFGQAASLDAADRLLGD